MTQLQGNGTADRAQTCYFEPSIFRYDSCNLFTILVIYSLSVLIYVNDIYHNREFSTIKSLDDCFQNTLRNPVLQRSLNKKCPKAVGSIWYTVGSTGRRIMVGPLIMNVGPMK